MVNRSSWTYTGTPTTVAIRSTSARADCAALPSEPSMFNGKPTTIATASSSTTIFAMFLWSPPWEPQRCNTVNGEAIVPLRSDAAIPMRFDPRSIPRTRTVTERSPKRLSPRFEQSVEPRQVLLGFCHLQLQYHLCRHRRHQQHEQHL